MEDDKVIMVLQVKEEHRELMELGMTANIDNKFWRIVGIDNDEGFVYFKPANGSYSNEFN